MPAFQYTVATASSRDLGIRLEVRPLSDILKRRRDLLQQDVEWLDAWNLKLGDPASTALHVCFVGKEGQVNQKNNLLDTEIDVRERQLSENDWILCVNGVRGPNAILEFLSTRAQDGKRLWLHFEIFRPAFGQEAPCSSSTRLAMLESARLAKERCTEVECEARSAVSAQLVGSQRHAAMEAASTLARSAAEIIIDHNGFLVIAKDYDGNQEGQGGYLSVFKGERVRILSKLHRGADTDLFNEYVYVRVMDGETEGFFCGWRNSD